MKYILILALILTGCSSGEGSDKQTNTIEIEPQAEIINEAPLEDVYILAGQSNVGFCDWSYLEERLGVKTLSIHYNGAGIYELIVRYISSDEYSNKISKFNPLGIIFVHGEEDGRIGTPGKEYADLVEQYRQEISSSVNKNLDLIISTVGYRTSQGPENYDILRDAVLETQNPYWDIGFNGAQYFIEMGYLYDHVHFNESGCIAMMDSLIETINTP